MVNVWKGVTETYREKTDRMPKTAEKIRLVNHPEEGTNISPETLVSCQEWRRIITQKLTYKQKKIYSYRRCPVLQDSNSESPKWQFPLLAFFSVLNLRPFCTFLLTVVILSRLWQQAITTWTTGSTTGVWKNQQIYDNKHPTVATQVFLEDSYSSAMLQAGQAAALAGNALPPSWVT